MHSTTNHSAQTVCPPGFNPSAISRYLGYLVDSAGAKLADGERVLLHHQALTLGLVTPKGGLTPAGYRFWRSGG